jgi:EAL domain-containing protein (putative c-di-GMP-specific phosphodiesterase class I)
LSVIWRSNGENVTALLNDPLTEGFLAVSMDDSNASSEAVSAKNLYDHETDILERLLTGLSKRARALRESDNEVLKQFEKALQNQKIRRALTDPQDLRPIEYRYERTYSGLIKSPPHEQVKYEALASVREQDSGDQGEYSHTKKGWIPPMTLFGILNDREEFKFTGLGSQYRSWLLVSHMNDFYQFIKRTDQTAYKEYNLALNIEPQDLFNANDPNDPLCQQFRKDIETSIDLFFKCGYKNITLEATERGVWTPECVDFMLALEKKGVHLSIDDYGAGRNNVGTLIAFSKARNLDIKIDGGLVKDFLKGENSEIRETARRTIVQHVRDIYSRRKNPTLVFEWVETFDEYARLSDMLAGEGFPDCVHFVQSRNLKGSQEDFFDGYQAHLRDRSAKTAPTFHHS